MRQFAKVFDDPAFPNHRGHPWRIEPILARGEE
jgi:hypothetical protein